MAYTVTLRSAEQILSDLVRTVRANTDSNDVAVGSSLSVLLEGIARSDFKTEQSALKILENTNIDSLDGVSLDKYAKSIRLPDGQGGYGRLPATQASGVVTIGSGFQKISSTLYAGKPAPFAGSLTMFLTSAVGFPATGQIYIARGTADRFEGPISYTSVTNNGSFWTLQLATPLTKSHLTSDLVVLAQGGNRTITSGTTVQVPASSTAAAISYIINSTVVIPDGEATVSAQVTCTQFSELGNALAGAISTFSSPPFVGATVTNPSSYVNGKSSESQEAIRIRIKNFPATLSRGTDVAIVASIQGLVDPVSGQTITSSVVINPTEPGDSSKVYIDDGSGLEPTFNVQPYELLLQSASGQEEDFRSSQFPITSAVIIGANFGPFVIQAGQSIKVTADGVNEIYTITPSNYANLNSATAYEIVRDFNAQSNIIGFRTINGGTGIAAFDLSGHTEELSVSPSDLQAILGLPIATVRPVFLYNNNVLQSFRGHTATLSSNPYPWGLVAADLNAVPVVVDGVTQVITISDSDFATFSTNIATATLTQWATVFSRKIAGVKFTISGNVLVWSTYQSLSPTGSLQIPIQRADGSSVGWISDSKFWQTTISGGKLSDVGATKNFDFNRFTGEIHLTSKPAIGAKIELGSRTTRGQIASPVAPAGLFSLSPLIATTGSSKMVVGFDGSFNTRSVVIAVGATITPTFPDSVNASNIVRLTANDPGLFVNAVVGDYLYLVKDVSSVPSWGANIEGMYRLKRVGINGFSSPQTYSSLQANTLSGTNVVTITQLDHGFRTGALISFTTAATIGGISGANLSVANAQITVLNNSQYTYVAAATASGTAQGTISSGVYQSDTWVEFEVSQEQQPDWTSLVGLAQSVTAAMINVFLATTLPQIVDFGNTGAATADQVVALVSAQISSGSIVKVSPQQVVLRSNDFATGTVAVLASIGSAKNLFLVSSATSIQAHIGYSSSGYTASGFPVISSFGNPDIASNNAWRFNLGVDKNLTDIIDTANNPTIESPSGVVVYPKGFEQLWITGRQAGLVSRVYNNQTAAPYTGIVRATKAIRPLETSDTVQDAAGDLNRYANYGLRFTDLSLTTHDRLVVEMNLNPTDSTVAIPMAKSAIVQDIDAITGSGAGQVISFRLQDPDDIDPGTLLPREFFSNTSVYSTYDFSDFRLVTKSIALYRDFTSTTAYPYGTLAALASGVVGIQDQDTFTLSDGVTSKIFEFDSNGSVTPGHVAVTFVAGAFATGQITALPMGLADIQDGDTFTLNDGVNPQATFEFDSNGSFIPGNVQIVVIAPLAATGSLTATPADPGTGITNGDTFDLSDGVTTKTFEFNTGAVGVGHVQVLLPSTTATVGQVKTAIIAAIQGSVLAITVTSGAGNLITLQQNSLGTTGNVAITESFFNGVSLFPTGMSGGVDGYTAAQVRTAILAAISGYSPSLITAAATGIADISFTNQAHGTAGNQPITQSIASLATLSPTGMTGGVNDTPALTLRATMISAINGSGLTIISSTGPGALIELSNTVSGPTGNVTITESIAAPTTLLPTGMAGGAVAATNDRALVVRSTEYGSPARLRISILFASTPNITDFVISHANTFDPSGNNTQTTLLVALPSTAAVAGSLFNAGQYTVFVVPSGTQYRLTFVAAGLNPSSQYTLSKQLSIGGSGSFSGTYQIVAASNGSVTVLAPATGGLTNGQVVSAVDFPLVCFAVVPKSYADLVTAINAYLPANPIVTAQALGTNLPSHPILAATYQAYPNAAPYSGTSMSGGFAWHSYNAHLAGSAGVFRYDSSNPALNGIKATVQSDDAIFPTTAEAAGTTYTPIGEHVALIPSNSKSLSSWISFPAASALGILASIDQIRSSSQVQISSLFDGSLGAVKVTGVTANTVVSFVSGNATSDGASTKLSLLATDAQSLTRGSLVRLDNSVTTELRRPYRTTEAAVTPYNTTVVNTALRPSNSIKYRRLTATTARITFVRVGRGLGQSEPLAIGAQLTVTLLSGGKIRVQSNTSDLAARVGDMAYVPPSSALPADMRCNALPTSGVTSGTHPEYLGYPVVNVIDRHTVILNAPNVTSAGTYTTTAATDLVFLSAPYSEKNIRTNYQEGAAYSLTYNGGQFDYLLKKVGGNMMSLWLMNSAAQATNTMRLGDTQVNTDDYLTLGAGFNPANQGTFRVVAHNSADHILFYNPNGGVDEVLDTATISGGGTGSRDWQVGPVVGTRSVRVVDAESVRIGDRLRISTAAATTQWFPDTMIGSFQIIGLGSIGIDQATGTLTAVPSDPSTGIADGDFFVLSDGNVSDIFEFTTSGTVASGRVAILISPSAGATAVRNAIIAAINGQGSSLAVTATPSVTPNVIDLFNRRQDASANVAITESFVNAVTLSPTGMSGAAKNDGSIESYVDILLPNGAPLDIYGQTSGLPLDRFLVGGNDSAIGFIEGVPYFGYRYVAGYGVDPINAQSSELFLLPHNAADKIAQTFGTSVTTLYKAGYSTSAFQGIDGYKVFSGLVQLAHRTIDSLPSNPVLYPGVKAMGTDVEVLPPLVRAISIALQVSPKDGVTLNSISDVVRATVSTYINSLGVGQSVILAEIVRVVQSLPGVYSVTVLSSLPAATFDRIVVSSIEKCLVLDASRDINIG